MGKIIVNAPFGEIGEEMVLSNFKYCIVIFLYRLKKTIQVVRIAGKPFGFEPDD
jgi:hypothetical protein